MAGWAVLSFLLFLRWRERQHKRLLVVDLDFQVSGFCLPVEVPGQTRKRRNHLDWAMGLLVENEDLSAARFLVCDQSPVGRKAVQTDATNLLLLVSQILPMANALEGGIAFFGDHRGVVTVAEVYAALDLCNATCGSEPDKDSYE